MRGRRSRRFRKREGVKPPQTRLRSRRLGFPDVRGLQALGTARHLELDPVTLGEALEALSLDGAEVHEHVLAALLSDEPETLRVVEPLHCSLSHCPSSFLCER